MDKNNATEIAKDYVSGLNETLSFGEEIFIKGMDVIGIDPVRFLFITLFLLIMGISMVKKVKFVWWGLFVFLGVLLVMVVLGV